MENFSRKNYIAGLLPMVLIIWALGIIILNSFNWYGHCVTRYDHFKSNTLVSCVGYETEDLGQLYISGIARVVEIFSRKQIWSGRQGSSL